MTPDGVCKILPDSLCGIEVTNLLRPHPCRQAELRTRPQPMRELISPGMVLNRVNRDTLEPVHEFLEVRGPSDLAPVRHSEYEVAEVHLIDHELLYPPVQLGVLLVQEADAQRLGILLQFDVLRLEQYGHVAMTLLSVAHQLKASRVPLSALVGELAVGENSDYVVVVPVDDRLGGIHV